MSTFAKALEHWKDGRSAESCAFLLGISPNTLRNWLAGTTLPPATRVPGLAAAMGVGESRLRQAINRERDHSDAGSSSVPSGAQPTPTGTRS